MWTDCIPFILVYDVFLMTLHMEQCFELHRALPTWKRGASISHRGGQELTCQVCLPTDAVPCCLQGSMKSHPSCSQNSQILGSFNMRHRKCKHVHTLFMSVSVQPVGDVSDSHCWLSAAGQQWLCSVKPRTIQVWGRKNSTLFSFLTYLTFNTLWGQWTATFLEDELHMLSSSLADAAMLDSFVWL